MNFSFEDEKSVDKTLDGLLRSYYGYKVASDLTDKGVNYYMGSGQRKLEEKERLLSIIEKQRKLGLPQDTDDYEKAVNEDKPFYTQAQNALGKRVLQAVPSRNLLEPKASNFFEIAGHVEDALPSFKRSSLNLGGNRYARLLRGATSAAFAL